MKWGGVGWGRGRGMCLGHEHTHVRACVRTRGVARRCVVGGVVGFRVLAWMHVGRKGVYHVCKHEVVVSILVPQVHTAGLTRVPAVFVAAALRSTKCRERRLFRV